MSQIVFRTSVYNKNIEMCYKSLENFKEYTMIMLEEIETDDESTTFDLTTGLHAKGHNETYRQYAEWMKNHYDAYTSAIKRLENEGWFTT